MESGREKLRIWNISFILPLFCDAVPNCIQ